MTLNLIGHNAGFFSCCCVRLDQIIVFTNKNNKSPIIINNIDSFHWYSPNKNIDILPSFFIIDELVEIDPKLQVNFHGGDSQFEKYCNRQLSLLNPYIKKYFCPSPDILAIKNMILKKYSINCDDICCLFLRGNDKSKECRIPDYSEYINKAQYILQTNPNIKFIIQSDELEFIEKLKLVFPNNIIFYDEIRIISKNTSSTVDNHGSTPVQNFEYAKKFLSIVLIMADCKYIVCNTGNISLWIALFRNNINNFIQL